MTRIKLCGLFRTCDIEAANELKPEYAGFVFAPESRRRITLKQAAEFRKKLDPDIRAAGVFVNAGVQTVSELLGSGIIDIAQLHGDEDETYIRRLQKLTGRPIVRAFRIGDKNDVKRAERSTADCILLDAGAGGGITFDWDLIRGIRRPYFLAGGLDCGNVRTALRRLKPFAVDVSSGIETDGLKDRKKMAAFVAAVRKEG